MCVARNHRNIGAAEAARKKFSIYCDLLMRLEKSEVRNGRSRKGQEQERGGRGSSTEYRAERAGELQGGGDEASNGQWVQSVAAAAAAALSTHTGTSCARSLSVCLPACLPVCVCVGLINNFI